MLVAAAALLSGCGGTHVRLTVTPASAPLDVPFTIRATGLDPRQTLTVVASGQSSLNGVHWQGSRKAVANAHGELVLRDRYLLAWLRPKPAGAIGSWPEKINVVVRGRDVDATASARRAPPPESLVSSEQRPATSGFYGDWIAPPGARHHTAILLFGGSDGGLPSYVDRIGATLAGDGYPVLELAYFREPGLPQHLSRIPLEYFRRALEWMRRQPAVDTRRIVTVGVSRGGELSLILAATYPRLVRAAVGYVPSAWVEAAFTSQFAPAWTYRAKPYWGGDDRVIPVEQSAGPIFVVDGGADGIWPSGRSVKSIARRMRAHGRTDVTALVYAKAGHLVGTGVPVQAAPAVASEQTAGWGGTPAADERGRQDSWPKLLRFLSRL